MAAASTEHRSSRRLSAARRAQPLSRSLCAAGALCALALAVDPEAASEALGAGFEPVFAVASAERSFASLSSSSFLGSGRALLEILGPLLMATVAGVLAIGFAQRASSSLAADTRASAERSSPFDVADRMRQLLAPERALDALFALLASAVLALVAWLTLAPSIRGVLALPGADPLVAAPRLLELLGTLALRLMLAGLALGALDHLQRRVRHARSLRMTRRELLDEQREQYGDPELRRERARRMRERSARGGPG
jgi:flagellar biosynthesis protein FlhB